LVNENIRQASTKVASRAGKVQSTWSRYFTGAEERYVPSLGTEPLLETQSHDLEAMLNDLPSSIHYSALVIDLDDGSTISIPRRELLDVKAQLKVEGDGKRLGAFT
jgi:hypothetical protein